MHSLKLFLFASLFASPLVSAADPGQKPLTDRLSGTLFLDSDREPLTFNYSTHDPHESNWIALYRESRDGPANEAYSSPPLVWEYAPERQGSVYLAVNQIADSHSPGKYKAYFLANDGHRWLAPPVSVSLAGLSVNSGLRFPVDHATLHNSRQLEQYSARIDGLLLGQGSATTSFQKIEGASWVQVDSNGTAFGVPGIFAPRRSQVVVRATADGGSSAVIRLTIPVRRIHQALVRDLHILTWNLWHGGTQVRDYHEKQLRFILESGADIVCLQETTSDHATRLGQALGWYHWQSGKSVGIISRYPIVEEYGEITRAGGARIGLNGKRSGTELNLWTIHTGAYPYGPYDFCFDHLTPDQVLADEIKSLRVPQVTQTLDGIQNQLDDAQSVPVVFTGDFNAPSHLDWVESTRDNHCGVGNFSWPTSVLMAERGFVDSFRVVHPDPVRDPGNTWSPILPRHDGETGPIEPQDRIDFIYHKGRLEVVGSQKLVVGKPSPSPNHANNEWTSDHAALLTHYLV
ncbi:Endonuclease/Exonuclease/phosphatase family [Aspergillus sclerotialis]|uniref:Endonuclease/Exonuclease/phosphatase family n=1 Tax=Aspergillus sclerotialis TaxID=2070753 RepID=A0A3A3A3E1_9EURO|nr:Endonuclease/Exonuclease/phosphatase family [Aspergillus sclerotialis]